MPTPTKDDLLQLARNYMEARILLTGAELDLFTLLAAEPQSAEALAARLGANLRALTILLDALAGVEVLSKHDGQYRCEPELARYLSAQSPESALPMIHHTAALWCRWSRLTEIVRDTAAPDTGPRSSEDQRAFIGAMAVVSAPLAASIAAAVKPGSAKSLLDIGGGPGVYTLAFLRAAPTLRATLFDLPPVVEMAHERLTQAGVLSRVRFVAGDFDTDELPAGHDLALLSAIIHQNSPAENVELYRKVFRALDPGGRIVIRDHVLQPDRTRSRAAAVFAVNMLVGTAGGNCYTFDDIRTGLTQAGFHRVRLIQGSDQMAALVEAFKPPA